MSLLLAAALSMQGTMVRAECGDRLCNAQAMASFFDKLERADREPVRVLQIGDSHTAGDAITQGWREAWQGRYRYGGRGVLPAGRPYNGFLSWGVTNAQSSGWTVNGIFGRVWNANGPAVGLAGFTQTARMSGASVGVTADSESQNFDMVIVCGLTGPDQGAVRIDLGYSTATVTFASDRTGARCETLESPSLVGSASVTTLTDQPVSITSLGTFRKAGGISISNLGVSGSQWQHQLRSSDAVIEAELRAYRPDLVVIAFGTNEGFSPSFDLQFHERNARNQVERIRRLAGWNVPILLIGAPDAATRSMAVASNGLSPPVPCDGGWATPGLLADVREQQRRLAFQLGLGFWDWNAAMGGACTIGTWQQNGLARGDRVHFTRAGGAQIGGRLADDLTTAARTARR